MMPADPGVFRAVPYPDIDGFGKIHGSVLLLFLHSLPFPLLSFRKAGRYPVLTVKMIISCFPGSVHVRPGGGREFRNSLTRPRRLWYAEFTADGRTTACISRTAFKENEYISPFRCHGRDWLRIYQWKPEFPEFDEK
jgi:hypothetical protein